MARKRSVNNSANARAQGGQKEQKMKVQAESHANSNSNNVKGTASQTIQGPYEIQQAVTSSKQAPAPANPSFAPSLQSISPTGSLGQSLLFVQYPPSNSSGQMGSLQGQSTFQTGFSGQSLFFIQYPPSNPSGQMGSYQPQVSTSMAMGPYASPAAQHGNSSHYYNLYAATAPSYSTQGMYPYSTVTGNVYGSVPRLVGYNYGGPHVIPCLDDYGGQLGLELSKLSVSATTQDDYTDSTGNNLPSSNWQRFQDAGSNMPQSTLLDLMQSYTNR
ncbi:hypothetical protein BDZ91DRAFT_791770 [Kalaharituber pfeilii]|nr:hypothetical protein BDZ91DRAFT_791770 [Kalaharituber pfeilii]